MLFPEDYPGILVTVAHPQGDVAVPLDEWIRTGPGPPAKSMGTRSPPASSPSPNR